MHYATEMKDTLVVSSNTLSALAAFAAAVLWYRSTRVEIDYVEPVADDGNFNGEAVTVRGRRGQQVDTEKTASAQARWNRYAAFAASVAAFCQGFATLLPLVWPTSS